MALSNWIFSFSFHLTFLSFLLIMKKKERSRLCMSLRMRTLNSNRNM